MKRMSIIGVCIAAVMALSVIVAGTAQATVTASEIGQCITLGKYTEPKEKKGLYNNANCTEYHTKVKKGKPEKDGKGNYEWRQGPALTCEPVKAKHGKYEDAACLKLHEKIKKGVGTPDGKGNFEKLLAYDNGPGFTAKDENSSSLKIPAKSITTTCTKYTVAGTEKSATQSSITATFTGCTISIEEHSCHSVHPATLSGTIETLPLTAEPTIFGGQPGSKISPRAEGSEVGNGTYLADYECGKPHGRVKQHITGIYTGGNMINKMGTTLMEQADATHGEQALTEEFSFEGNPFEAEAPGTQEDASEITYESESELRTEAPTCTGKVVC